MSNQTTQIDRGVSKTLQSNCWTTAHLKVESGLFPGLLHHAKTITCIQEQKLWALTASWHQGNLYAQKKSLMALVICDYIVLMN